MAESRAAELGLQPLGRLVAWAYTGCDPARMGLGPVSAIRKLGEATGKAPREVDLIEINEAFAAQVLAVLQGLGDVPEDRLNVNGGAIALGPSRRGHWRAPDTHCPQGAGPARRPLRNRVRLRRRRPGSGVLLEPMKRIRIEIRNSD